MTLIIKLLKRSIQPFPSIYVSLMAEAKVKGIGCEGYSEPDSPSQMRVANSNLARARQRHQWLSPQHVALDDFWPLPCSAIFWGG